MASPATHDENYLRSSQCDSEYGPDFSLEEEQILDQLIDGLRSGQPVTEAAEDNPIITEIEQHDPQHNLRLPRVVGREQRSPLFHAARAAANVAQRINEWYPQTHSQLRGPSLETEEPLDLGPQEAQVVDTRSPLERFRTQPKKALSVTDLVSPAWCELQYWYTLTRHGRKRRTPAMKQGSVIHKDLEDQVHTTVTVEIETKEDAWGLRLWNVIQGLRTLRDTGQTRELEIWGTLDGLVVNGVIDELSYVCPDADLEESLQNPSRQDEPPPDQTTISDFFKASGDTSIAGAVKGKRHSLTKKVYICDVKTRSARSLPSGTAFRPTQMQLMLYHNLFSSLATGNVDFSILTSRYNLDAAKLFSDSFIAQVGSLNDEIFYDAQSNPNASQGSHGISSQDSGTTLLVHNSLSALWELMLSEFKLTLPYGVESLGNILKAEYRSRDTGKIMGSKTIVMDDILLKSYLDDEMRWWRGEREALGVVVEEAYKCQSCEFADDCQWRLGKVEEAREKVRMTRKRTSLV